MRVIASCARRNFAAATIFMADVICMVFCTDAMRSLTSLSPPAMGLSVLGGQFFRCGRQDLLLLVSILAVLELIHRITVLAAHIIDER